MDIEYPYNIKIRFPGNLEYIPAVRKLIYDVLKVSGFSNKFAFRSEIIIDEICNNAVSYGCHSEDSEIELGCEVFDDHIEFIVQDEGGSAVHKDKLRKAIEDKTDYVRKDDFSNGLGLDIVRMLSEKIEIKVDESNLTSVHIIRKREAAHT